MAPMRQQPINDDSWTEAEAMRLVRGLAGAGLGASGLRALQAEHANLDEGEARKAVLSRTVEDEVIPRLLMARRPARLARTADLAPPPGEEQIAELVGLLLGSSQPRAAAYVETLRDGGLTAETLMLDLLAPSARRLGLMWEEDACDFTDVTMGVLRLANVMRLISQAFEMEFDQSRVAPSALLVQMPGEQHGLGLAMVVHFFRNAGWNVRSATAITSEELVALVKNDWFSLVGISVACSDRLEDLAADIRALRRASRNRAIGVMVGGPPFIEHPQLAQMVGADTTAADGRLAVQQAQCLVSLRARER